jgi:hypothetical protein
VAVWRPHRHTATAAFQPMAKLIILFCKQNRRSINRYAAWLNVIMAEEYTRLHITPLNPDLLKTIIPASILPNACHISYHTIQTFPEKSYGYVELPVMDAEKIKKKLNGSILKGTKVKIDKARPQKEAVLEEAVAEPDRPKKEKKKKRKRDELSGVEIGERRVKRGWTTQNLNILLGRNACSRRFCPPMLPRKPKSRK